SCTRSDPEGQPRSACITANPIETPISSETRCWSASRSDGAAMRMRSTGPRRGLSASRIVRAPTEKETPMGKWSRAELEEAFENYQRLALEAGTTGNWDNWAKQFTVDATYIEHLYGTMGGREAIHRWISHTMSQPINRDMRFFPVEWYMIDEEKGWV